MTKDSAVEIFREDVILGTYGEILYEDDRKIILATERRLDKDIIPTLYRYFSLIQKPLIVRRSK